MSTSPSCKPSPDHDAQAKSLVTEFARNLATEFGDLDRPARLRLVNITRRELLRAKPRGRKPDPRITAAYEDWMKGMRGVALYRKHILGYDQMSEWRRRGESRKLMEAIRSRRRQNDQESVDVKVIQ